MNQRIAQGTFSLSPASIICIKWPEDKLGLMWALPWYFPQLLKNVFIQSSVSAPCQNMQLPKKMLRSCVAELELENPQGKNTGHRVRQKLYTKGNNKLV